MSTVHFRSPLTPLQRYGLGALALRPGALSWLLENAARLDGRGVDELEVGQAAAARMAGRASVASMRYNLTLAYLSCWYGSAVAAPLDVGPPRARVLLGGWMG